MTQITNRIVILGGGFGGLYTALALSRLPWSKSEQPQITLVDQRDRFLFSPLLYELLTGELQTWEIAPPFEELLENTGCRFRQGAVDRIEIESRQVTLQDGTTLPYDRLVLALGGETPVGDVPGVSEHAIPFRTIEDAYRLEERLRELQTAEVDKIRVAVVGGGYSGVELACKLADRLGDRGRLRVVDRGAEILRNSPTFNREAAQKALSDRGVWLDLETMVEGVTADSLSLKYRDRVDIIPVEIVVWTIGVQVAGIIRSLNLKQNQQQKIVVDSTLQVVDHAEIFALGDLADCRDAEGRQVAATAQVALQQADYCGWNIWASLTDRPMLPFRYQHLGEMITLGADNATLTGLGIQLDGITAHVARRLAYLYRLPTLDHQIKVGMNWIGQPIRDFLSI